ncbi:MAG: PadR family transcriptional regulator [Lachnospiraceae bacterium]|nr:PadR family transcriptional regulator [Lachnospiraceae bacterium]
MRELEVRKQTTDLHYCGGDMNAQLKKGVLELTILREINKGDLYGYELAKMLGEYYTDVDLSSYYTILRRLRRKELVSCYEGSKSEGPPRKYYQITNRGKEYLCQRMAEWKHIQQIQQKLVQRF